MGWGALPFSCPYLDWPIRLLVFSKLDQEIGDEMMNRLDALADLGFDVKEAAE